jgi:hypothetical protein
MKTPPEHPRSEPEGPAVEIDPLFPRRPQLRPWGRRPAERVGAAPLGHRGFMPIQRAPHTCRNPDDHYLVVHSSQSLH